MSFLLRKVYSKYLFSSTSIKLAKLEFLKYLSVSNLNKSKQNNEIPTNKPNFEKLKKNNSIKKCQGLKESLQDFGQPSFSTHPHLFDVSTSQNEENIQVTPGLSKKEFEERRHKYVSYLTNYQMFYFSSKLSESEKLKLKNEAASNWRLKGFDKQTIDHNFIAIIPSCMNSFMAPDIPYIFKQNTDFFYLTGFKETKSVLVISRTDEDAARNSFKVALFVRDKDPKTDLWEGPCTGKDRVKDLCGIQNAYSLDEFRSYLDSLVKETSSNKKITLWRYPTESVMKEFGPNCKIDSIENDLDQFVKEQTSNKLIDMDSLDPIDATSAASYFNTSRYFVQLCRVKKSKVEIEIMKKACEISSEAFINSMKISHPFISEHLIHSKFDYDCKIRGSEYLAYIPVIAGGPRATIIHYIRNNQIISNGSLLLMDAGCQYRDYASDITRTWPINGRFTSAQKDLYEACLNVQKYCLNNCQQGITLHNLYNLMMHKLSEELSNLDLIDKKEHESIVKKNDPTKRLPLHYLKKLAEFCPHDIGHYLGLDVHDCPEISKSLELEQDTVITIEPGIYIRPDNENVPFKYRGVGIRIEDDVAIKSNGCDVLSKSLPKEINEIEALMKI